MVSPSYFRNPDGTAAAKINRAGETWHRTGDLFRRDREGRLWFCGRKSQRIETAGGVLTTVAYENVISEHPAVRRAALVGVGPRRQEPIACLELAQGHALTPALANDLDRLARGTPFEGRVRRFVRHRRLPVDVRHNSKIQRETLQDWVASRRESAVVVEGL